MDAGEDLFDALGHRPFVFVEPGNAFALTSVFPLILFAEFHVAADRHEVHQIIRQQIEPFTELSAIEQIGLTIKEFLDLLLQFEIRKSLFHSAALWIGCRSRPSNESQASPFMYRAYTR